MLDPENLRHRLRALLSGSQFRIHLSSSLSEYFLQLSSGLPPALVGRAVFQPVMFSHFPFYFDLGGVLENFIRGGSATRSDPYPFIYHFWQKRYPFHMPFIEK